MQALNLIRQWHRLRAGWRRETLVYRALDADSAAIRARHLQSISRLTPLMMFGTLSGSVLLVIGLQEAVSPWQLGTWLTVMAGLCGLALLSWARHHRHPPEFASPRAITQAVQGAWMLGLMWTLAVASWFADLQHDQQLLLSTLMVGMMCGGAFALASVPQAACAFIGSMALGSAMALARSGAVVHVYLLGLVLLYSLVLCLCVVINARVHTARLVSEREAERQGQVVSLLLRDFEEHSADLLWEAGRDGCFTRASLRLAAALGSSVERLQATPLIDALQACRSPNQDGDQFDEVATAIRDGRPFRELCVAVRTEAGLRWWSITAKPLAATAEPAAGPVMGWRGVLADVTAARLSHERLAQMAHFDSLTGLANRPHLREHVQQALARTLGNAAERGTHADSRSSSTESAQPADAAPTPQLALVCLDVDHFKSINDTLGHAVGDAVLVEVALRLRASLRQSDLAVRLGGDEFALVIEGVQDAGQVHGLAKRLVLALCQPLDIGGTTVPVSVSIGVAIAPEHGSSLEELLVNADLALYAAKENGRGRCELFSPHLGDRHRRRVLVSQELRGALARGEFTLAWQPQVHIESWRATGAEVLLRWQHPVLGAVAPTEFIAVAEEAGLIADIGAWVLEQACAGARQLPESMSVSVNASPAQLMREDFVASVARALKRSGLPARRLEIEITESLFMAAVPVAMTNLHGLRELGVRIALDDFGTGFSSLAYLLRFPFDVLKIDRAFVLELMARDDARALVRSIVEMARALGMGTVAEGVETAAQLEVLRQAGCGAVQGYLVAKPMPLEALQARLADWHDSPTRPRLEPQRPEATMQLH